MNVYKNTHISTENKVDDSEDNSSNNTEESKETVEA